MLRHATRLARAHEATLDTEFRAGDRVVTIDGFAGRVLFVSESFSPGLTEYQVELDSGMGAGDFLASQLRKVPESYRAPSGLVSNLPAGVAAFITEDQARQVWRDSPEARSGMSAEEALRQHVAWQEARLASFWYPEMGTVLHERPDPGKLDQVIGLRRTAAFEHEDPRDGDPNGGSADVGIYWGQPAQQQWVDENLGEPQEIPEPGPIQAVAVTYYHGTHIPFRPGEMVEPGHDPNWADEPEEHVSVTDSPAEAHSWARSDMGERHVFEVEPTGRVWGGRGEYGSEHPFRVVREVPEEEIFKRATTINGQMIDSHGDAPGHGTEPRAADPGSYDSRSTEGDGDPVMSEPVPGHGKTKEEMKKGNNAAQVGMYPEGMSAGDGPALEIGAFVANVPWTGHERTELHDFDTGDGASDGDFVPSGQFTGRHPAPPYGPDPAAEVVMEELARQGTPHEASEDSYWESHLRGTHGYGDEAIGRIRARGTRLAHAHAALHDAGAPAHEHPRLWEPMPAPGSPAAAGGGAASPGPLSAVPGSPAQIQHGPASWSHAEQLARYSVAGPRAYPVAVAGAGAPASPAPPAGSHLDDLADALVRRIFQRQPAGGGMEDSLDDPAPAGPAEDLGGTGDPDNSLDTTEGKTEPDTASAQVSSPPGADTQQDIKPGGVPAAAQPMHDPAHPVTPQAPGPDMAGSQDPAMPPFAWPVKAPAPPPKMAPWTQGTKPPPGAIPPAPPEEPQGKDGGGSPAAKEKKAALAMFTAAAASPSFRWEFTAAWRDVVAKATRIRKADGVRITHHSAGMTIGEVRGDHDVYESGIQRTPGHPQSIQHWACGCPWATFHQDGSLGTRYAGRPCSHVYALQLESASRGAHGREVTPDMPISDLGAPFQYNVVVKSEPPWGPGGWSRTWLAPAASLSKSASWSPLAEIRAALLVTEWIEDIDDLQRCAGIVTADQANAPWGGQNVMEHPPGAPYGATQPRNPGDNPASAGFLTDSDPDDWGEIDQGSWLQMPLSNAASLAPGLLWPATAVLGDDGVPAGCSQEDTPRDPEGIRMEESAGPGCACCGGLGEHPTGHECYRCDASGTAEGRELDEPFCAEVFRDRAMHDRGCPHCCSQPTADDFQDRGEPVRQQLGIDGTAGGAQDVPHGAVPDPQNPGVCLACGVSTLAHDHGGAEAELRSEPEAALPATTADEPEPPPGARSYAALRSLFGGLPHADPPAPDPAVAGPGMSPHDEDLSPDDVSIQTVGNSDGQWSGGGTDSGEVTVPAGQPQGEDAIIAAFQRSAAARSYTGSGGGGPRGGSGSAPGDSDIAAAAAAFLRTGQVLPAAEAQALISEGAGTQARNLGLLDIEGTHYSALGDDEADQAADSVLWI